MSPFVVYLTGLSGALFPSGEDRVSSTGSHFKYALRVLGSTPRMNPESGLDLLRWQTESRKRVQSFSLANHTPTYACTGSYGRFNVIGQCKISASYTSENATLEVRTSRPFK